MLYTSYQTEVEGYTKLKQTNPKEELLPPTHPDTQTHIWRKDPKRKQRLMKLILTVSNRWSGKVESRVIHQELTANH